MSNLFINEESRRQLRGLLASPLSATPWVFGQHERLINAGLAEAVAVKTHKTLRTRTVIVDEYRISITKAGQEFLAKESVAQNV